MADIFKRQSVFYGAIADLSGTTPTDSVDDDILAKPFVLRRVLARVTTGITVSPTVITVQWRPTPGTGTFTTLATFTLPVAAANAYFEFNVEREDHTATETSGFPGQPSDASAYLIGEQRRDTADGVTLVGPGGELRIVGDGAASAGAADFWLEVETRATAGELPNTNVQPA